MSSARARREGRRGSAEDLAVTYQGAVLRLAGQLLQFDGFGESGVSFVSHAHVRVPPGAEQIITSDISMRLLGPRARRALATPYQREFSLGELELKLLPSGHVPGAAALAVRYRRKTYVYAGQIGGCMAHFGLPGPQPAQCHTLVMASTYGHPRFSFPRPDEVVEKLCAFCERARADAVVPVLVCHPFGKAQLLAGVLTREGFGVRMHRLFHRSLGPLRDLGMDVGSARRFEGTVSEGEVLFWPLNRHGDAALGALGPTRRALVSGRAALPDAAGAYGCAWGFALSDAGDHRALVHYAVASGARRVYLLAGDERGLAPALCDRGMEVVPLGPPLQMEMFGT